MGRTKDELINDEESGQPVVIAIDFDKTICDSDYPACGDAIKDAILVIRTLYAVGYGIIINTCRTQQAEAEAISWLKNHGIPFDYVNCNFPYRIQYFGQDCRKISAEYYVDDKNIGGLPSWMEIFKFITNKHW